MSEHLNSVVMKFGGTSVGDVAAFERVCGIVASQVDRRPAIVVSAMTKVTDALLAAFETARKGDPDAAVASLEPHFDRHVAITAAIGLPGNSRFREELDYSKSDLADLLKRVSRRSLPLSMLRDAVVSYGEQLSSRLLADVLASRGVDAFHLDSRRLIITDDEFGAAQPIEDETSSIVRAEVAPLLSTGKVPVMGGFIAGNRAGETTTLGRGGSDYSAALIAAAVKAGELQIWTDVTGVMTCDPRICGEARTVPFLSYDEAAELAYFGAKVLHPKTIKPAVDHSIPVRVCNTFEPETVGTMVVDRSGEAPDKIKSIAHKKNITILRITSARMLGAYGFMSAVFQVFDRHRTVIDVISTSEVSVALTLENANNLDKVVEDLSRLGEVEVEHGFAVVCVVGEGLRASTGLASKIFSTIEDINIALVSHGASSVNLTFVVNESDAPDVIKKLHEKFF